MSAELVFQVLLLGREREKEGKREGGSEGEGEKEGEWERGREG